jgi:hypothetical protein
MEIDKFAVSVEFEKPSKFNNYMEPITFIDIRKSDNIFLLKGNRQRAIEIIDASKNIFGLISRVFSFVALPIGDFIAKKWLKKTNNPYLDEIEQYAKILGIKGVYALNISYEWGCTSGAYQSQNSVKLARVLDWPFPKLGENIVVAHQLGVGGDFYNITWPAVSGVFQAMAPNRFAAALNQAPMRRYLTGVILDWVRNRFKFYSQNSLLPAHLLRNVFEEAKDYNQAKEMLCKIPVAMPVMYTLTGVKENEGCVIERTENDFVIRELQNDRVCVANHFESKFNGLNSWLPRAIDSSGRVCMANSLNANEVNESLDWFKEPIANTLSRLVMFADVKNNKLSVMGTDGENQVTEVFKL